MCESCRNLDLRFLRFAIVQNKFQQTNKTKIYHINDNHIKFGVSLHFGGIWPTVCRGVQKWKYFCLKINISKGNYLRVTFNFFFFTRRFLVFFFMPGSFLCKTKRKFFITGSSCIREFPPRVWWCIVVPLSLRKAKRKK